MKKSFHGECLTMKMRYDVHFGVFVFIERNEMWNLKMGIFSFFSLFSVFVLIEFNLVFATNSETEPYKIPRETENEHWKSIELPKVVVKLFWNSNVNEANVNRTEYGNESKIRDEYFVVCEC